MKESKEKFFSFLIKLFETMKELFTNNLEDKEVTNQLNLFQFIKEFLPLMKI